LLNWYLVIGLILAVAAGLRGVDDFVVNASARLRKRIPQALGKIIELLSYTPLVVIVLYFIPLVYIFRQGDTYTAVAFTASCGLALGLAFLGKYIFERVRPFGHTTYLGKVDSAFPSAHTAGSFAAAFAISVFFPEYALAVFVLASLVAFSRMYLQLHFFSDVAAGVLIAYLMVKLALGSSLLLFLGF
jgi:undecaprenyl-diphosphatase